MANDKLRKLSDLRSETIEEIEARFSESEINRLPNSFSKHIFALMNEKSIEASGVDDDLGWVRTSDGMIYYSPITHPALRRQYRYVGDLLPDAVSEDTFLAAIDVVQRNITDFTWPPERILRDTRDMVVMELGAYLGHKTLRFAKELSSAGGRVCAVEMMPDNCKILRKNIRVNGMENYVDVINVGVWHERGNVVGYSKGRQRNSIVSIDRLEDGIRVELDTDTLDGIIENWGQDKIDLVFMTVNGVEVEALAGFSHVQRVDSFFIAAPYPGRLVSKTNAQVCSDKLTELGYNIIDIGNPNRIIGTLKG